MSLLNIQHKTHYRYRQPVRLGPHRLMLRPRESREVRLVSSRIDVTPPAALTWTNDVFANAVGALAWRCWNGDADRPARRR
jgi:transglutaminase-like putative cysteine protease